ncbi:MAG: GAF domain-containing protein [Syntrophobacterales bacterium]|nr:GAF domain-containing protein [Syntrophobacterales bacterium]
MRKDTEQTYQKRIAQYRSELKAKDKLLSSIHKISSLLTRSISLEKVLTAITEETATVFGFTRVDISLVNEKDPNLLECKYVMGFSPEERERALGSPFRLDKHDCVETRTVKTGKVIYLKDYETDERLTEIDLKLAKIYSRVSGIAAPLKIKRNVIGFIGGDITGKKLDLTKNEIKLFSTFANQASIIIENALLHEQNEQKIEQLLSLQEINKKTSSAMSLKKLFHVISANALRITKASSCMLLLAESDSRFLKVVSQRGYSDTDVKKFRLKIGEGIVGWVAENGIPLLVKDVSEDPRYIEVKKNVKSELAVPLLSEKKVLGVLNVDSCEKDAFNNDDLELLMIFAGHTATLIENVRLYEQVITEKNFAENILESSPNGVVTVDCGRSIRSVNRKAEEILCLKRDEIIGKRVSDVFERNISEIIDSALNNHKAIENREIERMGKNGNVVTLGISSSFLKSHNTNVTGIIITIQNLTEIKKTEELIRRMDRLSSLGQLSAGIAHEVRNPLASINFNVQMLSKRLDKDDKTGDILNDTIKGIDRLKRLVKGMLDFTKPGIPSLKRGVINDVVRDSIALIDAQIKKRNIYLETKLGKDLPEIVFDPVQMQQVFVNLLLNAVEAVHEGGIINVKSMMGNNFNGNEKQLLVYIVDNGPGISPENLSKVFDPFFTTKPEGTGLGLSITCKILEQHNALIDVFSEGNRGATFVLRFPVNSVVEKTGHVSI